MILVIGILKCIIEMGLDLFFKFLKGFFYSGGGGG